MIIFLLNNYMYEKHIIKVLFLKALSHADIRNLQIYMNGNVKQYSNKTEKHLNLLIRLLLQEQKQSDEDLYSLLMMTQITVLFYRKTFFCYLQTFTIMS